MVDLKEYVTKSGNYVTVSLVESLPATDRTAVIMPESGMHTFDEGTPEADTKPYITLSVNKVLYKWTLSKTAAKVLSEELGTTDTDKWVGAVIKLLVIQTGDRKGVSATLIRAPEKR